MQAIAKSKKTQKHTDTLSIDKNVETDLDVERDWNNAEDRYAMIAQAAYYKAEQRGFAMGYEDVDWIEAEKELTELLGGSVDNEES